MAAEIVIIGSGFAARQLVKQLRQFDSSLAIRLIAADSCDDYSKPELSHVFSRGIPANALTQLSAQDFAEKNRLTLHPYTRVNRIDTVGHIVETDKGAFPYKKLVLATGATAIRPAIAGSELMFTLNSQQEYRLAESALRDARRILLLGGGLIGTELAMDLNRAGKDVILADRSSTLLASLMPAEISGRLQAHLTRAGVRMMLSAELHSLRADGSHLSASFQHHEPVNCDAVICAIGLRPETALAQRAGLTTQRGIVVGADLATSDPDIYALGDCAEIAGKHLPFLQPAQLSALILARILCGQPGQLQLPPMLVRVKTPDMPLHLAGDTTNPDLNWTMTFNRGGMIAKGCDKEGSLQAFVVSEDNMKLAFTLLKQLTL
nr:NADH:flavorubredoxin reductase NorW [Pantoea cypripedii]